MTPRKFIINISGHDEKLFFNSLKNYNNSQIKLKYEWFWV